MIRADPRLAVPPQEEGTRQASRRVLVISAAVLAVSLAAYLADMLAHPHSAILSWFDLGVYNHGGLLARHSPASLYTWRLHRGIAFTYTPFAALVFVPGSLLPWPLLRWLTTLASLAAVAATVWITLGALGWSGQRRKAGLLALTGIVLWTEPVERGLHLGQIEPLLMLLVVWDLCRSDQRRWKGVGIGVAAGIKLVPLIFIPYLVLTGRLRQAAVVCAAFAATVAAGFAFLPGQSVKYWLTGYFLRPGKVGDPASLLNQSLFGILARAEAGPRHSDHLYLALALVIGLAGTAAAALLHRSGRPVAGWVTCALTGLLCSPVSWDHHWVWIVPVMALLADGVVRSAGSRRLAYVLAGVGLFAVFGAWPGTLTGPDGWVPRGLLGEGPRPGPPHVEYHLQGIEVISWDLYALAGLVMFAVALVIAGRARRAGRSTVPGNAVLT
jgi:alpha-1,2-mannosyltransferase